MQIDQRLPIASVVEENRYVQRIVDGDKAVQCRRVHQSAALIGRGIGRVCEDVVSAFHGASEEDDAEAGEYSYD